MMRFSGWAALGLCVAIFPFSAQAEPLLLAQFDNPRPAIRRPGVGVPAQNQTPQAQMPQAQNQPQNQAPATQRPAIRIPGNARPVQAALTPLSDGPANILTPPADITMQVPAGSVTLSPRGYTEITRALPPMRQLNIATLRSQPRQLIGSMALDFQPLLNNPQALFNVAQRLKARSDLIDVRASELSVVEIRQGVLIHSLLTYRFKPGACRDAALRAQIAATGVQCFSQINPAQREAGFSNPRDIRYIEDPIKRSQAVAQSLAQSAQVNADIANSLSTFRNILKDPSQRAAVAAEIGADEVARMEALDDTSLAGELANNAEFKTEQTLFVPRYDPLKTVLGAKLGHQLGMEGNPKPPQPANAQYDLGTFVFLTGFTLASDYEWSQRVETTIKWCVLGCKKSYYAEFHAGFSYGFGLRFPLQVDGKVNFNADGTASLTPHVTPINGNPDAYAAAGLSADKIFEGKELVAEFAASAGASAKLPVVGVLGPVDFGVSMDFTKSLTGGFTNGQFTPPPPNQPGPSMTKVFDNVDLIGGRANFGVFGGQVFPQVRVELTSGALNVSLRETQGSQKVTPFSTNAQPIGLAVVPADRSVNFAIEKPVYNAAFEITPGIDARVFIDLAVWGNHWDWNIWFPQLAVKLPPDGVDFACHAGTICSRNFRFTQTGGAQATFLGQLDSWSRTYIDRYRPDCLDAICKQGIGLTAMVTVAQGKSLYSDNPQVTISAMAAYFAKADMSGKTYVNDSLARKSQATSNAMGILAQSIWSEKCKDLICFDNVKALSLQMGPRAKQVAQANPGQSVLWVNQQVNAEFVPKFKKEISDCDLRAQFAATRKLQQQMPAGKRPALR